MRRSNAFIAVIFLTAAVLLFLYGLTAFEPLTNAGAGTDGSADAVPLERPRVDYANPQQGPADAQVTVVEFGDYSCEPCKAMSADVSKIVTDYAGKVRLVWKDFPNQAMHPDSPSQAEAARCAGMLQDGAFWKYHDLLMGGPDISGTENFVTLGGTIGLDAQSMRDCLTNHTQGPVVQRDIDEGLRLRLDATPYLFVNARRVSGSVTYDQLKTLIDAELAKPPAK